MSNSEQEWGWLILDHLDQGVALFNQSLECIMRNFAMTQLWEKFLNRDRARNQDKTPPPVNLPDAIKAELKKYGVLFREEEIPRRVVRLSSASGEEFFLIFKGISHKGEQFYLAIFHEHRPRFENLREILEKEKGLSPQDVRVVDAVYRGLSTKEIANEMNLSAETVKSYLKDIFKKLHVHKRTELVYYIHQIL